jgi:hypothetical protein
VVEVVGSRKVKKNITYFSNILLYSVGGEEVVDALCAVRWWSPLAGQSAALGFIFSNLKKTPDTASLMSQRPWAEIIQRLRYSSQKTIRVEFERLKRLDGNTTKNQHVLKYMIE